MTVLDGRAVYNYAVGAGFTRAEAAIMTAIAHYESGWDTTNIGDQSLSKYGSRGLWQIFTGAHSPSEVLGHGGSTWTLALADELFDPVKCARAAHIVYREQGFRAWSTYNNYHTSSGFQKIVAEASHWSSPVNPQPTPPAPKPVAAPGSGPVATAPDPMSELRKKALANAERAVHDGTDFGVGMCLRTVRGYYELPADGNEPTAASAWDDCPKANRHPGGGTKAPAGVPFIFSGGSSGAGHIVLMLGDNKGGCISTDIKRPGKADYTTIGHILNTWTDLHAEGWVGHLEQVDIWHG